MAADCNGISCFNATTFDTQPLSTGRPMARIPSSHDGKRWNDIDYLVDTGNDITLIDTADANRLGMSCDGHTGVSGISGEVQQFCNSELLLSLEGKDSPARKIKALWGPLPGENLLGRRDILDKYSITFNPTSIDFVCLGCSNAI